MKSIKPGTAKSSGSYIKAKCTTSGKNDFDVRFQNLLDRKSASCSKVVACKRVMLSAPILGQPRINSASTLATNTFFKGLDEAESVSSSVPLQLTTLPYKNSFKALGNIYEALAEKHVPLFSIGPSVLLQQLENATKDNTCNSFGHDDGSDDEL